MHFGALSFAIRASRTTTVWTAGLPPKGEVVGDLLKVQRHFLADSRHHQDHGSLGPHTRLESLSSLCLSQDRYGSGCWCHSRYLTAMIFTNCMYFNGMPAFVFFARFCTPAGIFHQGITGALARRCRRRRRCCTALSRRRRRFCTALFATVPAMLHGSARSARHVANLRRHVANL